MDDTRRSGGTQGREPVDDALVDRCRHGDERAWAELYEQTWPTVARYLACLLGPFEDLDDLIQRVYVELFRTLPNYRGEAALTTWLYRLASWVARSELRTRRRRRRKTDALRASLVDAGAFRGGGTHARVEARQELGLLAGAVDDLGPKHRMVWLLREVERLPVDQIAAALEVPPGTVRSRLHHARKRVLACMDEHEPAPLRPIPLPAGREGGAP